MSNQAQRKTNGIVYDITADGFPREKYEAVNDDLFGNGLPDGLLHHVAWMDGDTFRLVEVWATEDAFRTFAGDALMPVLAKHGAPEPQLRAAPVVRRYDVAEP